MRFLGLCGVAGSGKDSTGALVQRLVDGTRCVALADAMKRWLWELEWFTWEQLWGPSEKRSERNRYGVSAREALQQLGTEWGRRLFGPDVWVDTLMRQCRLEPDVSLWVVTDVRFANEVAAIRKQGWVLQLVKDDVISTDPHASECEAQALPAGAFDAVVRFSGWEERNALVQACLQRFGVLREAKVG